MESREFAPKVLATYRAVIDLFREGADLNNLTVSEITAKAGIGKGTAYEYFSNKEEMIAGALFHELKRECQDMCRQLKEEEGLYARMDRVLISMEKKIVEINCFVRAIHVLMDNSAVSGKLREMMETKKEEDMLVMDIVRMILAGRQFLRLKTYTLYSFAYILYMNAKGKAIPLTVDSPSPKPGSITKFSFPFPNEI